MSGYRQQGFPIDPGVTRLIEGMDLKLQTLVFPDHFLRVLISVERVHQDQGNVALIGFVQMLKKKKNIINLKVTPSVCHSRLNRYTIWHEDT